MYLVALSEISTIKCLKSYLLITPDLKIFSHDGAHVLTVFQNLAPCWSSLTALAVKYSTDLKTYLDDILDTLEDLRWQKITEDTASVYTVSSE